MNEISKKRKEWVKTAAIIFLSVMLVLTFFSNTIMNYSLPEVAVKYVESGSITAKIRGNGVVESGDPYNVMVKQTRKVMSVAVRVGDQVQKGDVLLYLEDADSTELTEALAALETAQKAYDTALLAADVNAGIIQNAGSNISTDTYRKLLTNAQNEVKAAETDLASWQERYDEVNVELTLLQANKKDLAEEMKAVNEAQKVLNAAKLNKTAADNKVTDIEVKITSKQAEIDKCVPTVSGNEAAAAQLERLRGELAALKTQKEAAQKEVTAAEKAIRDAEYAKEVAEADLEEEKAEADVSNQIGQLQERLALMQVNLDASKTRLSEKEKVLSDLTDNISKSLNLGALQKEVDKAQEKVDKERAKSTDTVITADIAGTITQINTVAGKEVSAAEAAIIIQPEGQGYTMSFTVTNEQAKKLSVGDRAELVNSWYYNDMEIILSSIKTDKNNPGKQKVLTFEVKGDVMAGQSLNVSVGQKSANYDLIVPNSAIREDNNGKFILIVESKSSPLGNRYYASRVDVEVIASDDTKSAISGALYGYEYVLTTATKPVEAGQLVRLAEN